MIPFNADLAKLRILLRRAQTEEVKALKEFERIKEEAWKPAYEAREKTIRINSEIYRLAKELGYCSICEKPLEECKCVLMAKAS